MDPDGQHVTCGLFDTDEADEEVAMACATWYSYTVGSCVYLSCVYGISCCTFSIQATVVALVESLLKTAHQDLCKKSNVSIYSMTHEHPWMHV